MARSVGIETLAINDPEQFETAFDRIKPTIIVLDIVMPGRDGTELVGQLAAGNYPGKIVLMSGADPAYMQMSSRLGKTHGLMIAETLMKPSRKQQVVSLLSRLGA